ncbi:hypothetical protein [Candidatus Mycoplasma mahonii]|uniref:hypothetical protein n=1 Tax=Candidatus Mycoplasma mahonii TaxID=3004105 RepID=UPI0026F26D91|nr:hypothetical protein [Candidatus Mycoplasma mahonii]WKX02357.1 hypothetical protein O3I44_03070 [Candidatus Mycoplasma mahonii]
MIYFERIKGLTQESIAVKATKMANKFEQMGYQIVSITQYADSNSIGRNKACTIYYKK